MTWSALAMREFKEHVRPATKWSGTLIAALVLTVIMSVGATVAAGFSGATARDLGEGEISQTLLILITLGAGSIMGLVMSSMVPMNLGIDAVAGERERHTLGTLLATPIPDSSILLAKLVAILGITAIAAALGGFGIWITMGVLYGLAGLAWGVLAIPTMIIGSAIFGFFTGCFAIFVSIRSKTVKDAGQKLSFLVLPTMLPVFLVGPLLETDAKVFVVVLSVVYGLVSLVTVFIIPVWTFVRFRRDLLLTV